MDGRGGKNSLMRAKSKFLTLSQDTSGLNKKILFISYLFIIGSFLFLFYSIFSAPYARKIPYFGKFIYSRQLMNYAKQFPADSMERLRFEAIAGAVKNGQKDYNFMPPPNSFNTLSNH